MPDPRPRMPALELLAESVTVKVRSRCGHTWRWTFLRSPDSPSGQSMASILVMRGMVSEVPPADSVEGRRAGRLLTFRQLVEELQCPRCGVSISDGLPDAVDGYDQDVVYAGAAVVHVHEGACPDQGSELNMAWLRDSGAMIRDPSFN